MSQQVVIVRLGNRFKTASLQCEAEGVALFSLIGKSRKTLSEAIADLVKTGSGDSQTAIAEQIKLAKAEALTPKAKVETAKIETAPKAKR